MKSSLINQTRKTISVVIPVFNEFENLPELTSRLETLITNQQEFAWEVIYVNDGSSDGSSMLMSKLAGQHSWLSVLHLSRNFGHQIAISAGIDYARGDAVIVMDGDLQDPPELLPEMIDRWIGGYDVVYATRKTREGESWFKLATAKIFYRILKKMANVDIPVDTGDFRLMSRPVVDAFSLMREKNRFIRGMVSWLGFSQTSVEYERDKRFHGTTKFTVTKMLSFAIDGMLSFSKVPLKWITTTGFIFSGISFLGILAIFYLALVMQVTLPGWSSLMTAVLFMGGIQLICLGMIGEYIARIFDEVRNRPLYLISRIDSNQHSHAIQTHRQPLRELTLYDHHPAIATHV